MGDLTEKLRQVVKGARGLWVSRDPNSYSRYRFERISKRKRAAHERREHNEAVTDTHEDAEREDAYAERYAREREQDIERQHGKQMDSP